jgi:hypothetical protein
MVTVNKFSRNFLGVFIMQHHRLDFTLRVASSIATCCILNSFQGTQMMLPGSPSFKLPTAHCMVAGYELQKLNVTNAKVLSGQHATKHLKRI